MNPNSCDDARFDRLVDGELSPADYRQVLATLDDEPGGWRRCALAFLEAQAWRQDFGGLRREAEPQQVATVAQRHSWPRTLTAILALAACFLVAFGLGALITGPLQSPFGGTRANVAKNDPVPPANSAARPNLAASTSPNTGPSPAGRTPAGHVTLVVRGENGQAQEMDVPVFSPGEGAAVANQPSAIPPEVLAALERMGHNVRRQQQLVPVDLQDGRHVVVPVEQLEIVPVGGPAFQ